MIIGKDFGPSDIFYAGSNTGDYNELLEDRIEYTSMYTMSIDTGDIDNDLDLEIYLAGITFSGGLFKMHFEDRDNFEYKGCNEIENQFEREKCKKYLEYYSLLRKNNIDQQYNIQDINNSISIYISCRISIYLIEDYINEFYHV